jgi:hypothetical protein
MLPAMANPFFTIGHSTHPIEEFVGLLTAARVRLVVDVRTVPRSRRNPHFNREILPASLAKHGIAYEHCPALGGLRKKQSGVPAEANAFWENASFHNYADYAWRGIPLGPGQTARAWTRDAPERHVRGGRLVAMPSPHHRGPSDRGGRERVPHPRAWSRRESAFDARSPGRAGWKANLSKGHAAYAGPPAVSRFAVRGARNTTALGRRQFLAENQKRG